METRSVQMTTRKRLMCLAPALLGVALILSFFCLSLRSGGKSTSTPVLHLVRGRVINLDGRPLRSTKVQLARSRAALIGSQTLGYEGSFAFEGLPSGIYVLTLEREGAATIVRTIEIKSYPTPKTIFLEIRLDQESAASVREIVTEFSRQDPSKRVETPTRVSKKAQRAFQQAVEESERGNRLKAVEYLEKAIREQPDYFEAYNNLGIQHQKLRQWPQAIQAFRRAIECRGDSAKPFLNLGLVYWEQGEIHSAIESFESARKLDDGSMLAHYALGQLYFRSQNYVKAQKHLEIATRLNPKEARSAFLLLAQLEVLSQNPGRAKEYLEVMLQYFPSDPEALRLRQTLEEGPEP
jgi:tetratricopeptide (TPR) repeat protein